MAGLFGSIAKVRAKMQRRPKIAPWPRVALFVLKLNASAMSRKMPRQTTQTSRATGGIMAGGGRA